MADGKVVIDVDMDTDQAERDFDSFQDRLRASAGAFRGLGVLLGSSLTSPILATGLAAIGALTASFAAAGAGVLAFSAIAIPALGGVFEASAEIEKINKRIAEADTTKERAAAMKELEAVMGGLTAKEREALQALQDFKSFWGSFAGQFKEPILDLFIASLGTLKNLIIQLKPLFEASIPAIQGVFEQLDGAIKSGALKPFIEWLASSAGSSLSSFATIAGNGLKGIMNLMKAFSPLTAGMENSLVSMSEKFANWSANLSKSKGFQEFIDYVKANAPTLKGFLKELGTLLVNLGTALAPIGAVVLKVGHAILQGINWFLGLHPAVGTTILSLAGLGFAFKALAPIVTGAVNLFGRIGPALQKIGPFFTKLGTQLKTFGTMIMTALRTGFTWLMNGLRLIATGIGRVIAFIPRIIAGFTGFLNILRIVAMFLFTNPLGLIIVAITAVVAAAIWLYQNWDMVKGWLIAAWNAIKAAAIAVWGWMSPYLTAIWNGIKAVATAVWNGIKSFLVSLWNGIKSVASSVWNGIKSTLISVMNSIRSTMTSVWNAIKSRLTSVWNAMKSTARSVWNGIKSTLTSVVNSIRSTMTSVWNSIKSTASNVWNSIKSTASNAWNSIKSTISNGIRSAYNTIKGYVGQFKSAGKSLLNALADGIKSGINKAIGAVKSGMATIRSYLPFSPAKVGPLADLDKSGESFFPTFASKMNRGLTPAIHQIDAGLSKLNTRLNQERLRTPTESMSGATTTNTVNVYPQRANLNPAQLMRELQRASRLNGRTLL